MSIKFQSIYSLFYPCLSVTHGFNTVTFSFHGTLVKIYAFHVLIPKMYLVDSFYMYFDIRVIFNSRTKYRLSVRHAVQIS